MPLLKRVGLCLLLLCLPVAACDQSPASPTPAGETETLDVPTTTAAETPRPPTATSTPRGRVLLTARREMTMYSGPGEMYQVLDAALPVNTEFVVIGRDEDEEWAQVGYQSRRGWIPVDETDVIILGVLADVPIVPVLPVTDTPPPPTETYTPAPTLTPFPTLTIAPTSTSAPTPEDRDSRILPGRAFGTVAGDLNMSGEGALAILNDTYDYISWHFDPSIKGSISLELAVTCSDPNAEIVATLYNSTRTDPIERLYPVCNEGPLVFNALDPVGIYQLEFWLRDERPGEVDVTLEPDLMTIYTFRLKRP